MLTVVDGGPSLGFPVTVSPATQMGLRLEEIHPMTLPRQGKGGGTTSIATANDGNPRDGSAQRGIFFEKLPSPTQGLQFLPTRKFDRTPEDLEVFLTDFFQKVSIDPGHEKSGGKVGAIGGGNEAIRFFKVVPRPKVLQPKKAGHAGGGGGFAKIFLGDPKGLPLLLRQVDSAKLLQIVGHISQNIG